LAEEEGLERLRDDRRRDGRGERERERDSRSDAIRGRRLALDLLEEELADLTPAQMLALSQELRRTARQERSQNAFGFLRGNTGSMLLVGVLALLLLPQLRQLLRPVAAAAAQGAGDLTSNAQDLVQGAQEWLEDVVAEAQFNKLQRGAYGPAAGGKAAQ